MIATGMSSAASFSYFRNRLCSGFVLGVLALAVSGCVTPDAGSGATSVPAKKPTPQLSDADRDPDRLRFMKPDRVVGLIGKPSFVRHDARVMVWQYQAGGCVLDLFWYQTDTGPELMHYDARSPRLSRITEAKTCFTGLLNRQAQSVES